MLAFNRNVIDDASLHVMMPAFNLNIYLRDRIRSLSLPVLQRAPFLFCRTATGRERRL